MPSKHSRKPNRFTQHDGKASPGQRDRPPGDSLSLTLSSPSATKSLGRLIGRALKGGEVLALMGELGAGKTALVKGIATGIDVPATSVSSPTFVLIHEYRGRLPFIHVDLYRLRTHAEAEGIGLQEYFIGHTVTAIEWADRFPAILPEDRLEIRLMHRGSNVRTAWFSAQGAQSLSLLQHIAEGSRSFPQSSTSRSARPGGRRKAVRR